MASPLAHSVLGIAAGQAYRCASWRERLALWLWMVFSANAPDLDFFAGMLVGDMNRWHHGFSHSLLAVLGWGLLSWFIARGRLAWPTRFALISAGAYASHLLVDALTYDAREPFGIALFWPLQQHFIFPFSLFSGVRHGVPGDSLASALSQVFSLHNAGVMAREFFLTLPVVLLIWVVHHRKR